MNSTARSAASCTRSTVPTSTCWARSSRRWAARRASTPRSRGLVGQFARALEQDIERHFRFEEESLFPRMADAGDGDMAALLVEEHEAIREVAAELLPLARPPPRAPIDEAGWAPLRRSALELVERQVAHIQKETMALLPLLDDLLDEETDRELAFAYAEPVTHNERTLP